MSPTHVISSAGRKAQHTSRALLGTAKTLAYAGLGVVAVVQEEASETYARLVREGRTVNAGRASTYTAEAYAAAAPDARGLQTQLAAGAERAVGEAGRSAGETAQAVEDRVQHTLVAVLQRMNVPTREDLDALKRSVERLDQQTATLRGA